MRRRPLLAAAAGSAALAPLRARLARSTADDGPRPDPGAVDVLLVLAVDVSRSIVAEEMRLQREGYRAAVGDPDVVRAIRDGTAGAIGLAYIEWADFDRQRLVLPWTRIAAARDAAAWAEALAAAPPPAPATYTSISGAVDHARRLLAEAPWPAARRVVDVSGDGQNNDGDPPADARDRAVAEGIIVNGLPILGHGPAEPTDPYLEDYFRASVAGGPGAFVVAAEDFGAFGRAVRRKLIREIAARTPARGGGGGTERG
jgi:hypothetical protein